MIYRIGIKRRYWFGYKVYRVIGHRTEKITEFGESCAPRLILRITSHAQVIISQIDKRDWMIYPEYHHLIENPPEPEEVRPWHTDPEVKNDNA